MKNFFIVILLSFYSIALFGYSDSDLDGVEDRLDRCPNTPFMDLVDIHGCSKKTLLQPKEETVSSHYDIVVGATYSNSDYNTLNQTDTYASTLQVDYYYKNFSLQAATSYYYTDGNGYSDSGMYDTFIGASYQKKFFKTLSISLGVGALLPTYDSSLNNNNTDYTFSLSASYLYGKYSFFGGFGYTLINDDDVVIFDSNNNAIEVQYQNTFAFNGGMGYYITPQTYISLSYSCAQSIYQSYEELETTSAYVYYGIDLHWFTTFTYAYGLSDTASKHYGAIRLGYYF